MAGEWSHIKAKLSGVCIQRKTRLNTELNCADARGRPHSEKVQDLKIFDWVASLISGNKEGQKNYF